MSSKFDITCNSLECCVYQVATATSPEVIAEKYPSVYKSAMRTSNLTGKMIKKITREAKKSQKAGFIEEKDEGMRVIQRKLIVDLVMEKRANDENREMMKSLFRHYALLSAACSQVGEGDTSTLTFKKLAKAELSEADPKTYNFPLDVDNVLLFDRENNLHIVKGSMHRGRRVYFHLEYDSDAGKAVIYLSKTRKGAMDAKKPMA